MHIDAACAVLRGLEKERDSALAYIAGIRGFSELIEAGLMSVADAVLSVDANLGRGAQLACAKLTAAATVRNGMIVKAGLDAVASAITATGPKDASGDRLIAALDKAGL